MFLCIFIKRVVKLLKLFRNIAVINQDNMDFFFQG
jgi:hypothetical protein